MSRILPAALLTVTSLIGEPPVLAQTAPLCEPEPAATQACAAGGDRLYLHPLGAQTWPTAQVPLLDVRDDRAGRRYAFVDGGSSLGGRVTRRRGVASLERTRLRPS